MKKVSLFYQAEATTFLWLCRYEGFQQHSSCSLLKYIRAAALEYNDTNVNNFINTLDQKLVMAYLSYLIKIHTMLELQGALGLFGSHYSMIAVIGPSIFTSSYMFLREPNVLRFIVKACVFNQYTIINSSARFSSFFLIVFHLV